MHPPVITKYTQPPARSLTLQAVAPRIPRPQPKAVDHRKGLKLGGFPRVVVVLSQVQPRVPPAARKDPVIKV